MPKRYQDPVLSYHLHINTLKGTTKGTTVDLLRIKKPLQGTEATILTLKSPFYMGVPLPRDISLTLHKHPMRVTKSGMNI